MRGVTYWKYFNCTCWQFLLTRLMRGVTTAKWYQDFSAYHFYSHASCEAWLTYAGDMAGATGISTHTPHARRDEISEGQANETFHFYSHASCEAWRKGKKFTLQMIHFYSHASCEAWPQNMYIFAATPQHIGGHFIYMLRKSIFICKNNKIYYVFSANLTIFVRTYEVRYMLYFLYNDHSFWVISFFCSNMFHFSFPVITKIIKP